jgi:hypothetical protein
MDKGTIAMTLYQYNQLDKTDQACVLWNKGVFLCERKMDQYTIALYQIEGFYVELFYHPEDNAIEKLRSFRSTGQLNPYLNRIDVSKLF